MSEHLSPIDPQNPGFDPGEPNTKGLTIFIVLFLATLLLVIAATAVYFQFIHEGQQEQAVLARPSEELAALHAREDQQLKTYGYIDRKKGVVQIPLERAMELVAKEAAEGKVRYSTAPTPVKKEEPAAAAAPAPEAGAAQK
jgi:hypothetical protein